MVTFMRASDNNRAATVADCFHRAVSTFGWPSRVRGDYGKENWDVKYLMESMRGTLFVQGIAEESLSITEMRFI